MSPFPLFLVTASKAVAAAWGETLEVIGNLPGASVSDIAAVRNRSLSTVSSTLDQLEAQKLIRREQAAPGGSFSRRTRRSFLTPEGAEIRKRLKEP